MTSTDHHMLSRITDAALCMLACCSDVTSVTMLLR